MALASAFSVGLRGLEGEVVEIEADIGQGLPGVSLVGLPDAALGESRDRVRAAVVNSGEQWPARRVTLALSPATLPKQGSGYDLALACAVLAAARSVPPRELRDTVLLGELALDGRIRGVRGVLPSLLAARRAGVGRALVPAEAVEEAAHVEGIDVLGAATLADVLAWLRGRQGRLSRSGDPLRPPPPPPEDLADVVGQAGARRAVEVAAAGGHHLLMVGPPGSGKTMLARRLVGILPDLEVEAALQVAAVRSLAGVFDPDDPLPTLAPFVAPHHTVSSAGLTGGGTGLARPGAVSLAHRGILFLDEVYEFSARMLETLRTPLEDGEVRIARKDGTVCYPAAFQLVMAANPCPCAGPRPESCSCSPLERRKYTSRLSGPLLDRVDLRVGLDPVSTFEVDVDAQGPAEDTATVRRRVVAARERARERWRDRGWRCNADVPGPVLRRLGALPRAVSKEIDEHMRFGMITARGADRSTRVAWTLADLRDADRPDAADVHTALELKHLGNAS